MAVRYSDAFFSRLMDADDAIPENMLECLLLNSKNVDVIISSVRRCFDTNVRYDSVLSIPDCEINSFNQLSIFLGYAIKNSSRGIFFYYIWNKLYRASVIKDNKVKFDESMNYGEDFFFLSDLYKLTSRIRIINQVNYTYYIRGTASLVGRFHKDEYLFRDKSYRKMTDLFKYYGIYDRNYKELKKHEGQCTLNGLAKINSITCDLSKKEKKAYIKNMLSNQRRYCIVNYLLSCPNIKAKIKALIYLCGNSGVIYWLISKNR